MRKRLTIRFLLAYVLVAICSQVLSNGVWILQQGWRIVRSGSSLNMISMLQDYVGYLGESLSSALLPGLDVSSLVKVIVSAGILVAGAALYANGPVRQYRSFCERVDLLASGVDVPVAAAKVAPDLQGRLDAVAARVLDAETALQVCRANSQQAQMLLAAATTQIEVVMEAGILAEGSAEVTLIQDALDKIKRVQSQITGC